MSTDEGSAFALARRVVHGPPVDLSDQILFVDAEAIVIDKPAGLPVDTPRRGGDSIVSRLDELKCGFKRPPTPMHRLDTDTSGCLLFARSPRARAAFQQALEARRVEKYYLAVVGSSSIRSTRMIGSPSSALKRYLPLRALKQSLTIRGLKGKG